MNKLDKIQKIMKIGRVISVIVLALLAVAAAVCTVVLFAIPDGSEAVYKIVGAGPMGLVLLGRYSLAEARVTLPAAIILLIGYICVAAYAVIYFSHEISDGTPLSERSVAELTILGASAIAYPTVAYVLAIAVEAAFSKIADITVNYPVELFFGLGGAVAVGLVLLFAAAICRSVAEASRTCETDGEPDTVENGSERE